MQLQDQLEFNQEMKRIMESMKKSKNRDLVERRRKAEQQRELKNMIHCRGYRD